MNAPFAAALIAGGRSTRFGSDKAFHPIDGVPLWQHQLAKLEPLMPSEILISANADQQFDTPHRVVVDAEPDRGPLGALVSCLLATKLDRLLVLAIDLPDMPMNFLGELAYAGCGAVPQHTDGMAEPLVAVYPRAILALAEAQLAARKLAMRDLVALGTADNILQIRPVRAEEVAYFRNLNRP